MKIMIKSIASTISEEQGKVLKPTELMPSEEQGKVLLLTVCMPSEEHGKNYEKSSLSPLLKSEGKG